MRSIYNKTVVFILIMSCCFLLPGCGKNVQLPEDDMQEGIELYYLNKEGNGLKAVPYTLDNPNDPDAAIKEMLFHLKDTEGNNTDQYKPSIYDGIIISSITIKESTAVLDFESNYQQLSADQEILMRSSIVKSLVQIDGVDSVTFTVNGSTLTGMDGKAIGVMTADSFLLSRNDLYTQSEEVSLYYANEKGDGLVEVKKDIEVTDNMPIEQGMLLALIHDFGPEGTKNPLPSNLTVNQTQVYNNICYVDLGSEIEEILPDVEDKIKIYAMVNTLVSRGTASQVQFTVDGKKLKKLNDIENFDQPMTCDYSLSDPDIEVLTEEE